MRGNTSRQKTSKSNITHSWKSITAKTWFPLPNETGRPSGLPFPDARNNNIRHRFFNTRKNIL